MDKTKYYMSTVQHTGTIYHLTNLKRIVGPIKFQHYHLSRWERQWKHYWEYRDLNPLVFDFTQGEWQHGYQFKDASKNAYSDKHELHKALDNNDLSYFYKKIPKKVIDYAHQPPLGRINDPALGVQQ